MFELTYSWECKRCGWKFEERVRVEERSQKCPKCGGELKQEYTKSRALWRASLER